MAKDKEYTNWDKKGPIAKQLVEHFELFSKTNGAAGIDPNYTKPATIRKKGMRRKRLSPSHKSTVLCKALPLDC